jgi:23S rRNA pseudouridine1911/1915/1917 synthase
MHSFSYDLVVEHARFLVVAKPGGIPTVPLARAQDGPSLLAWIGADFAEVLQPMGRHGHEGGILHRLDTDTCGLVLVARDPEAYASLQQAQLSGNFIKTYMAAVSSARPSDGFPPFPICDHGASQVCLSSKFRAYGNGRKAVRPVTVDSSPLVQAKAGDRTYTTRVLESGANINGHQLVSCSLDNGFRHQVRCHLAWRGTPIVGDPVYGGLGANCLHLAALEIRFPNPDDGELVRVRWADPPNWATPFETP